MDCGPETTLTRWGDEALLTVLRCFADAMILCGEARGRDSEQVRAVTVDNARSVTRTTLGVLLARDPREEEVAEIMSAVVDERADGGRR